MKKKNFITYFFIGIISIFFLMYPIMLVLINFNIITPTFSNIYSVEEEKGNILERLETKVTNIKNGVNNKLSNYLFLYSEINQIYPNIKNNVNLYSENDFLPLGTNTDGEYIFYKNGYYILETHRDNVYIKQNMEKTIKFWNDLSESEDLYIYLPSRYEFRSFNNAYSIRNMNELKNDYLKNLNANIKVKELEVNSEKEYNELFYKTDHHWNAYGALNGCYDICYMLEIDCNGYSVKETDKKYRGSIGKMISDAKNYDLFSYIETNLEVKATIDGKESPKNFKPMKLQDRKNIYYDQYVGFYNGLYSEVVYNYGNSDENLLIIGDSYSWQIDYILASHFNKTFVLNPKYVDNINLKEYIKNNKIDKTLVLMETHSTLFDNYNYGYIDKLGGK